MKAKAAKHYDADGCRWEKSKWPHPQYLRQMENRCLPDVIWIRYHTAFRGEMMEDITGWSSTKPNHG